MAYGYPSGKNTFVPSCSPADLGPAVKVYRCVDGSAFAYAALAPSGRWAGADNPVEAFNRLFDSPEPDGTTPPEAARSKVNRYKQIIMQVKRDG